MKIQVIVTCAASKTTEVPESLQFGKLPTLPVTEAVNEWVNRLKSTNVGLIKMIDLYKGGYWGIVKDINLKWLRKQMAIVSQEPKLFSGTMLPDSINRMRFLSELNPLLVPQTLESNVPL